MAGEEEGPTAGVSRALDRLGAIMVSVTASVADLMMPPVCLHCHAALASHNALCPACWRRIAFIRPPLCDRLGTPLPFDPGGTVVSAAGQADPPVYDRARAVARFDDIMRDLVHDLKFHDRHDARSLFGRWLADAGRDLLDGADLIVPVPLNRVRLLQRRFNQSAILAQELSAVTGVAIDPFVLVRTRRTAPQVGMSQRQRRENVAGAFALAAGKGAQMEGRNIVLVDDVITTGATVDACARALRQAGAARIDVLALALVCDGETPVG